MKKTNQHNISAKPTAIELIMEARPHHMSNKSLKGLFKELGNPMFKDNGDSITAVHTLEKIKYDHSEAEEGELVWACEKCGSYSKTKQVVVNHEKLCNN